ncbi:MAG: YgjV family protein [Bacilli bacterium]|nr:YgjV family protein [Bacilli bacterium]
MDLKLIIIIIAQVFGIISWLLLMYSYTKEDIDELLFIQILVCLFDVISYLLLGADAGLLICFVELLKTILYYKTNKDREIFIGTIIAYFLISLLTIKSWYAILPVLGSLIDSYGTSKDSKSANVCSIISNTLWTIYDLLILSYVGAFNDITVVLCNIGVIIFGYSKILNISKFRIVKCNSLTKDVLNKIHILDLNNYGKDNLWDNDYQKEIFKKNTDSLYVIKFKHDIVGYINYLNIDIEEYERIKRIKKYHKLDINKINKFKSGKKSYLIMESINIKKEYEKEESIDLIYKKIKHLINIKHRQRIYIHGIIGIAINEFENSIYKKMDFNKIKDINNNISLYELNEEQIKKIIN